MRRMFVRGKFQHLIEHSLLRVTVMRRAEKISRLKKLEFSCNEKERERALFLSSRTFFAVFLRKINFFLKYLIWGVRYWERGVRICIEFLHSKFHNMER